MNPYNYKTAVPLMQQGSKQISWGACLALTFICVLLSTIESSKSMDTGICCGLSFLGNAVIPTSRKAPLSTETTTMHGHCRQAQLSCCWNEAEIGADTSQVTMVVCHLPVVAATNKCGLVQTLNAMYDDFPLINLVISFCAKPMR